MSQSGARRAHVAVAPIYLHSVRPRGANQEAEACWTPGGGYYVMDCALARGNVSSWLLLSINLSVSADKELDDI